MARLSDYLKPDKRTHTEGMTAISAELRKAKRGYANGLPVVGSADVKPLRHETNEIILLIQNPIPLVEMNPYNVVLDGGVIIHDQRIKDLTATPTEFILGTSGYARTSTNYASWIQYNHCHRYQAKVRKHELWGRTSSGALTTNYGVRVGFNVNHMWNAFWFGELFWNGSAFQFNLYEWTSPTATVRATTTFSTAIDDPIIWHIIIYDTGDTVWAAIDIYENDAIADGETRMVYYTVANRLYKESTGAMFGVRQTPGMQWLLRGGMVSDLP